MKFGINIKTKTMKTILIIIALFLSVGLFAQTPSVTVTVEKVKTIMINGDTVYQVYKNIKDTSYITIKELNAVIDAKQAEINIYQGYISNCRVVIDAAKAKKVELKNKAQ